MRIWYRTGLALPAGVLRTMIPGHQGQGETSPDELTLVMRLFGLRPAVVQTAKDAIQESLIAAIRVGIPPIVLGYWESRTVLHYVLGVDASSSGFLVNDPWGGRRALLSWDQVDSAYAGWCIL